MDNIARKSILFDIYGNLLTDHQKKIYEDVVNNDYSLSEIGEEMGISRQGVHDAVKRIDKILEDYENKLHIAENYKKSLYCISKIKDDLSEIEDKGVDCSDIYALLDELSEGL